jgi:hypothetical protein
MEYVLRDQVPEFLACHAEKILHVGRAITLARQIALAQVRSKNTSLFDPCDSLLSSDSCILLMKRLTCPSS